MQQIIEKYNVPAPRYTSYPTVPHWQTDQPSQEQWLRKVKEKFDATNHTDGISLYIHLPYCESLCTYCGCNKRITKNHKVEDAYIVGLLQEWAIYKEALRNTPTITEIHLGGGTPTFFSPASLKRLITSILEGSQIAQNHEFSFEGHPNNTTMAHYQTLANLGFNRVSLGVQDFNRKVQIAINRIQPIANVRRAYLEAKQCGYQSINFDLVYGLPFQRLETFGETLKQLNEFMPERIALYSYAHVPWKSPSQRGYSEHDLPKAEEKLAMYQLALMVLKEMGYQEVGMDHFALPEDQLFKALKSGSLNRNFMGYTTNNTQLMIGLGCSSISSSTTAFVQNEKKVEHYLEAVSAGYLPLIKGHFLSDDDLSRQNLIKNLICNGHAVICDEIYKQITAKHWVSLREMETEKLLTIHGNEIEVSKEGMRYVRNICMLFDAYQTPAISSQNTFSKAI